MSLASRGSIAGEMNSISMNKGRNESSAGGSHGQNLQITQPNDENTAIREEASPQSNENFQF